MSSTARPAGKPMRAALTCPHLGMLDDTTTTTSFPSESNHCLHCRPACVPSRQHQLEYCLSPNFSGCQILNEPAARLPHSRRWARDPVEFRSIFIKTAIVVFALGLLAMFFILGAPARISRMIQAFVPDATREFYQPYNFSTSTPSATPDEDYAVPTFFLSEIEIPTAIPIQQIVKLTVIELEMGAYCRKGPNRAFEGVTILKTGNVLKALAQDSEGKYYLVRVPNQVVEDCWIAQDVVTAQGDPASLPVYTPMPTPWPTRTPTLVPPTPTETPLPVLPQKPAVPPTLTSTTAPLIPPPPLDTPDTEG